MRRALHYEIIKHPVTGYNVIVWDSDEKHRIMANNAFSSYREAAVWGRAVKSGKIKTREEQC
jgi:hypothetical protein